MSTNATPADKTAGSTDRTDLSDRDVRALTECLSVLDDLGPARDAPGLYQVVSHSGETYTVDVRTGACDCPDARHRDPDGGCKHLRRVRFATGERVVPAWIDTDAVDPQLGAHVDETPRVAATDGGVIDAGDEGEILDEDDRPDECQCVPAMWNGGLPCWPCYRAGFKEPNPDAPGADD